MLSAVEVAMRAYARSFGEDEEKWAAIGLIHDFDYQQNPSEETHVHVGMRILRERGWPEDWIDSHCLSRRLYGFAAGHAGQKGAVRRR